MERGHGQAKHVRIVLDLLLEELNLIVGARVQNVEDVRVCLLGIAPLHLS